jgi:hypothetical protein
VSDLDWNFRMDLPGLAWPVLYQDAAGTPMVRMLQASSGVIIGTGVLPERPPRPHAHQATMRAKI